MDRALSNGFKTPFHIGMDLAEEGCVAFIAYSGSFSTFATMPSKVFTIGIR